MDRFIFCRYCGKKTGWMDNQSNEFFVACKNNDCVAYAKPVVDLKDMDELDELRLRIARAKGLKAREVWPWKASVDNLFGLVEIEFSDEYCCDTREWLQVGELLYETQDGDSHDIHSLPDWSHDIGTAMVLLQEVLDTGAQVDIVMKSHIACITIAVELQQFYTKNGPTLAIAICLAWLAWKEVQA